MIVRWHQNHSCQSFGTLELYVCSAYVLQSQTRLSDPEVFAKLELLTPSIEVKKMIRALQSYWIEAAG